MSTLYDELKHWLTTSPWLVWSTRKCTWKESSPSSALNRRNKFIAPTWKNFGKLRVWIATEMILWVHKLTLKQDYIKPGLYSRSEFNTVWAPASSSREATLTTLVLTSPGCTLITSMPACFNSRRCKILANMTCTHKYESLQGQEVTQRSGTFESNIADVAYVPHLVSVLYASKQKFAHYIPGQACWFRRQ